MRKRLLQLAYESLASQTSGEPPDVFTVIVAIPDGSIRLEYTARAGEFGCDTDTESKLTEIQQAIVRVASQREPRQAKHLARLANYSINSYFRSTLSEMVRQGLLLHTPDGYLLPPDMPPDICQEDVT